MATRLRGGGAAPVRGTRRGAAGRAFTRGIRRVNAALRRQGRTTGLLRQRR